MIHYSPTEVESTFLMYKQVSRIQGENTWRRFLVESRGGPPTTSELEAWAKQRHPTAVCLKIGKNPNGGEGSCGFPLNLSLKLQETERGGSWLPLKTIPETGKPTSETQDNKALEVIKATWESSGARESGVPGSPASWAH